MIGSFLPNTVSHDENDSSNGEQSAVQLFQVNNTVCSPGSEWVQNTYALKYVAFLRIL